MFPQPVSKKKHVMHFLGIAGYYRKFCPNFSTIEKECLALILSLQYFNVYVSSPECPLIVYSDRNPLVFLHKLKDKNQHKLSEYNMNINHIKGQDNLIVDCLSKP